MTRHPSQLWTAQRLREATAEGSGPRHLIRDNDSKYGSAFDIVADAAGIEVKRTPIKAPLANGYASGCTSFERFGIMFVTG